MITPEQRDENLNYLATTDESYARAKSYMTGLKEYKDTVIAEMTLLSEQSTVALSTAEARSSKAYKEWRVKYQDSVYDYEILRNKRTTAALIIELWRSEFSALKQGIVF